MKKNLLKALFILSSSTLSATEEIGPSLEYNRIFPIWGNEAIKRGHTIPNPYGINFIYVDMKQNVDIDKLELTGNLDLKKTASGLNIGFLDPVLKDAAPVNLKDFITIKASTAESTNTNTFIRGDVWVLPFLNLYAVIGKTKGKSVAKIENNLNLKPILTPILEGIKDPTVLNSLKAQVKEQLKKELGSFIVGMIGPLVDNLIDKTLNDLSNNLDSIAPYTLNSDFTLEYEGITYGGGMVLAGKYKNFFTTLDLNYTLTKLDIIEGEISAFVFSPKIGYNFDYKTTKNYIWVGGMYQNITQTLKGSISDIIAIPGINGRFEVDEKSSSPWNTVLGLRSEINSAFEITTEVSLNKKKTFMLSLGYRF